MKRISRINLFCVKLPTKPGITDQWVLVGKLTPYLLNKISKTHTIHEIFDSCSPIFLARITELFSSLFWIYLQIKSEHLPEYSQGQVLLFFV